jgi:hypothetical protein
MYDNQNHAPDGSASSLADDVFYRLLKAEGDKPGLEFQTMPLSKEPSDIYESSAVLTITLPDVDRVLVERDGDEFNIRAGGLTIRIEVENNDKNIGLVDRLIELGELLKPLAAARLARAGGPR